MFALARWFFVRAQTHLLLRTLSHFSLAASNSELLLVDACLVDDRLVTGIQLHKLVSTTEKKSMTRVMAFAQRHECNEYCEALGLQVGVFSFLG